MRRTWSWGYHNGAIQFVSPTGKTFIREGYTGKDASTLCKYLNSR